jgi:hypothetical protein
MKKREVSDLLQEVLEQSASPEFKTALLENTLRAARHRKQVRQIGRSGLALAAILVALTVFFYKPTFPLFLQSQRSTVSIIHSQKLQPGILLATRQSVPQVVSSKLSYAVLNTQAGGFKILGDDELLACLAGHPAALVRRGNGSVELVFVNPADKDGFPVEHSSQ